jgi:hypothetical protein
VNRSSCGARIDATPRVRDVFHNLDLKRPETFYLGTSAGSYE